MFWAIVMAVFFGLFGATWAILEMTYRGGGNNADRWFFLHYPKIIYMTTVTTLEPPASTGRAWASSASAPSP